jgi:hypothetical protein
MGFAFDLIKRVLAVATVFISAQANAATLYTPEVEVGHFQSENNFNLRGHGIILRFAGKCLVVTLAHVAQSNPDDTQFESVTIRSSAGMVATADWVYHNQRIYDLYVGEIAADSPLSFECASAATLDDIYNVYFERLSGLQNEDFKTLLLQTGHESISLTVENDMALRDALGSEPIRYTVKECMSAICELPTQKLSGSIVSMKTSYSDQIVLGLHQGRCDLYCSGDRNVWQAVSMMTIYQFFYTPGFPVKNPKGTTQASSGSVDRPQIGITMRVQEQLVRLNCDPGQPDGKWGSRSVKALERFQSAYGNDVMRLSPGEEMLTTLQSYQAKSCPTICRKGSILAGGVCRSIEARKPEMKAASPARVTKPRAKPARPSDNSDNRCIHVNGKLAC